MGSRPVRRESDRRTRGERVTSGWRLWRSSFCTALLFVCTHVTAGVVINEIHYHPPSPDGKTLEFVELFNDSLDAVDLSGWSFSDGIEFRFPAGAAIDAGGFAVVARDRAALVEAFGLTESRVFGSFDGVLDNGGETIRLVDATNAHVDRVDYRDVPPWPQAPDGDGASLERVCATEPSWTYRNWSGRLGDLPTPLTANQRAACPLPPLESPAVVINEINYHPAGTLEDKLEFVELLNRTEVEIDVSGWSFVGIRFTIPAETVLAPGGMLVVCRNHEFVRDFYKVDNAIGNFEGILSNSGERLALVDAQGVLVDYVRYRDQDEWPIAADGVGRSLERIHPDLPGEDPASWISSTFSSDGFITVSLEGSLSNLSGQRAMIGINGEGEFIVDNFVLEDLANPGVNVVSQGDFEGDFSDWRARGASADSRIEPGIGVDGSWGLRVRSDRTCSDADCICPTSQAVAQTIRGLDNTSQFRFSVQFKPVSGSINFYAGMLKGMNFCFRDVLTSPGQVNSSFAAAAPPIVTDLGRFPTEPTSQDNTIISALVRVPNSEALDAVELHWQRRTGMPEGAGVEEEAGIVEMADDGAATNDGQSGDSVAGDGVFSGSLPRFPHNTAVTFFITARTESGLVGSWPRVADIDKVTRGELAGFYVNDEQVDTQLPEYQLILPDVDETNPDSINGVLNCSLLEECDFAFGGELYPSVGIRFRGNTACVLKKRNLKIRFNTGRLFRGLRKFNLQGIWTDKGLVREHLGWEFIRQLGIPYCETEYIRLQLNGAFHGLFLYLEHPDERYLERNGLSGFDCLYKAKQPSGQGPSLGVREADTVGQYEGLWERETCESEDFTEIADFIGALHDDAETSPGPTAQFHLDRTFVEWHIGYQVTQAVLNNIDSFAKNHFLVWNRSTDKWGLLCWDMDLIIGKNFDGRLNRLEPRRVGTINDCMLSPGDDLNPWFTTRINGNTQRNFLVDFFFRADRDYFRRAYIVRMLGVLREKFNVEAYSPELDRLSALLDAEQEIDFLRWGRSPVTCLNDCTNCATSLSMVGNLETIREQVTLHRNFLINYTARFHRAWLDYDHMKITEVMFNPVGASEELEYVELTDWQFAEGIQFVFPRETIVKPYGVVIVAKSRDAFLVQYPDLPDDVIVLGDYAGSLSNEGEALRLVDAGPGHPATIDFLEYEDGGEWPDVRDGHSIELSSFDLALDNDLAKEWQMSPAPFGTPGDVVGIDSKPFVRGDTNGDRYIDVSDAVLTLRYIWDFIETIPCPDAADTNDDGRLAVNDAVIGLQFLFQRGDPPPPPFPELGFDETEDDLICE